MRERIAGRSCDRTCGQFVGAPNIDRLRAASKIEHPAHEIGSQKALSFDQADLISHYDLAVVFSEKYNQTREVTPLLAAKNHFDTVVALNAHSVQAGRAKQYLENIDEVLRDIQ